ncbi:diacylglycerol kinase [Acidithiobacillus marinus]|uniref:Diacylglycerol kinase n=1 Tax=Acidithiobacillus marinus TaxID=187490 RepID=A0A2I1DQF0_9PROT|nr:diacylglycerol kinase [Acidithiobacillus marinus]PKY12069.1 diacylglycerol kinase [Acidithiobacillus marinus]
MNKNQPIWRRARYGLHGLGIAAREEASFRAELWALSGTVVVLIWVHASLMWWGMALLLMAMLMAAELLNTALESLADLVSPEFHPLVARAKDCGAAAVFVLSSAGVILLLLLLWQHFHSSSG